MTGTAPDTRPHLRVTRGTPDDDELAALVAVIGAVAAAATAEPPASRSRPTWSDPRAMLRRPIAHGPGAWRASGLLP